MLQLSACKAGDFLLEPIVKADQPFVFKGLSDPAVIQFYGVSYDSLEATAEQMDFYENLVKEERGAAWKIVDELNQEPIGVLAGYDYQAQHEKMEIGFWLLPEYQGKGILKSVLPFFLQQLQTLFKLHRLEATVESENLASCRLLERAGFEQEGLLRDCEIKNGKRISLFVYSLLLAN
ncbi:MAG: GNAT family N-acetyltransferase [Flavihumibacter sp.]|jgi:ribosomal-protein-alanine N-acetyltransferase|nr:GNAT family N-acetyltransferase [Flavihumibacter sp.]